MDAANTLITALGGEEVRWTQQSKLFDDTISRLIGDCAIACRWGGSLGQANGEERKKVYAHARGSDPWDAVQGGASGMQRRVPWQSRPPPCMLWHPTYLPCPCPPNCLSLPTLMPSLAPRSFVSYLGPFNKDFRELLLSRDFYASCVQLGIPVTKDLQVCLFVCMCCGGVGRQWRWWAWVIGGKRGWGRG